MASSSWIIQVGRMKPQEFLQGKEGHRRISVREGAVMVEAEVIFRGRDLKML